MNGKGRPEKLTDDLKLHITRLQKGRKKKLRAPEIQREIRAYIEELLRKANPTWTNGILKEEIEERLPGLSSIQKYLKDISGRDKPSELDNPWHMGTLDKHPIPAEALPYIFFVQSYLENYPDWFNNPPPQKPLTIRQAIWISRLYTSIDSDKLKKAKMRPSIGNYLYGWAVAYAQRNIESDLAGIDFDTTTLDKSFRNFDGYPVTVKNTSVVFNPETRSIKIDTLDKELIDQIEKMVKDGE